MLVWWTQILPDPWRWNISYSSLCSSLLQAVSAVMLWGRNHGGRSPSSDDNFHSPTSIPASSLDKLNIMKRYHHRQTCSHTSPHRSPTMVTLHDTRFVEWRWWSDGWIVTVVGIHDTGPWSVHGQKVPWTFLHFSPAKLWTSCDVYCACQSI